MGKAVQDERLTLDNPDKPGQILTSFVVNHQEMILTILRV